jgi:hypothetical protein
VTLFGEPPRAGEQDELHVGEAKWRQGGGHRALPAKGDVPEQKPGALRRSAGEAGHAQSPVEFATADEFRALGNPALWAIRPSVASGKSDVIIGPISGDFEAMHDPRSAVGEPVNVWLNRRATPANDVSSAYRSSPRSPRWST